MSHGYEQFFKKAKNNRDAGSPVTQPKKPMKKVKASSSTITSDGAAEEYLRSALKMKQIRKSRFPTMTVAICLSVVTFGLLGYYYQDKFEWLVNRIEVNFLGNANAAEGTKAAEKSSSPNADSQAKSAGPNQELAAKACTEVKGFTEEEMSHFNKLNERSQELDRREAELSALEEELHKQKEEIETRIAKLEQIRGDVASVLKDRVEIDQQRVSTLVDFYSNMKPKQAADVFANLNEDLAVEVLGRMKKKNAADILNLLEPTKARALSEKFTGYKRR